LSPLEQLIIAVDAAVAARARWGGRPAWVEDTKVMGSGLARTPLWAGEVEFY